MAANSVIVLIIKVIDEPVVSNGFDSFEVVHVGIGIGVEALMSAVVATFAVHGAQRLCTHSLILTLFEVGDRLETNFAGTLLGDNLLL